ncbi:MAG: pilus assembly protein PilM [Oscillospiraceae bacterium]|nr:pilus assembly protein PilM [Oscillospiraceae bacterium]
MAAKLLNIEICERTISICRTARTGKSVRIFDSFAFPTPDNCVSDGVILNPALLANELRMQLASHGVTRVRNTVFSLASSKIAVREVKLPPMKKKLIAAAIRTNSADYFPIDLKSYHITYYVLDTATSVKPYNRILVMAVPVSMIEGYFQLAERAGLYVKAIDSSGNSQYQALRQIDLKGVTAYADVSGSSSIVSFIRDGKLLLQRTLTFGSDVLISHYMSLTDRPGEDYIEILREMDVTSPEFAADKLLSPEEIQNDLESLVGGIMRSIDYFNSSQWDAPTSKIVLVGLNRHLVGLRDLIAESTGLDTLYLDDIPDFTQFTNIYPDAPAFVNCIGCSIDPLNLIPRQFRPSRRLTVEDDDSSVIPGVIMCGIIVFGAALLSVSSWLGYATAVNDLADAQAHVDSLQPAVDTYNQYISYQQSQKSVDSLKLISLNPNSNLVGFFDELEAKMPSSILVLSAACTNDGVSLNITVGSYKDAASVISTLRSFESVSQVQVSGLGRSSNETGSERVSFSVSCTYGANPYLNEINPYNEFIYSDTPSSAAAGSSSGSASDSQGQQP